MGQSRDADATNREDAVLFDGDCALCTSSVSFLRAHTRDGSLRFVPRDSSAAHQVDSLVLIRGDRVYVRSAAAVRLAGRLRGAWRLLALLWVIPRPLRDWAYDGTGWDTTADEALALARQACAVEERAGRQAGNLLHLADDRVFSRRLLQHRA